jgi:hypothetical protein
LFYVPLSTVRCSVAALSFYQDPDEFWNSDHVKLQKFPFNGVLSLEKYVRPAFFLG